MRNKIISVLLFLTAFAATTAKAHPLGNFSLNNFTRIEVEKNRILLHCVSDMAEIPTFQESQQIDADKDGALSQAELDAYLEKHTAQYAANLKLSIDGQPAALRTAAKNISVQNGSANLATIRIEWDFTAENPAGEAAAHRLRFENDNYAGRVGWNEIVAARDSGVNIFDSTAKGSQMSDELKSYPENMLAAPLSEREAEFSFSAGGVPADARALENRDGKLSAPAQKDGFAELISVPQITLSIALLGLIVAAGFGALHALSPGHGKTVVGAYLVGSRGTFKHAAFLGLTVTVTHTLGVFALGLITLFATGFVSPDRLMPILSFVSGLLLLLVGLTLLKTRLSAALGGEQSKDNHAEIHEREAELIEAAAYTHTHGGSTHTHLPPARATWRGIFALGVSGGLLPCPSALVLMLAAISRGRVGYGIFLTLAFSFGLAATLISVGLAFLYLGKIFDRPALGGNRLVKALPVASAFVIACIGAVICYNSVA